MDRGKAAATGENVFIYFLNIPWDRNRGEASAIAKCFVADGDRIHGNDDSLQFPAIFECR